MDERYLIVGLLAFCIAIISAGFYIAVKDQQQWEAFSAQHNCKVVGRMSGDVHTGMAIGPNGQMQTVITSTPDKVGYLCDDGVTYWR